MFVPIVEIEIEEQGADGWWHQKFTLSDGIHSGSRRYVVDRSGPDKLDLTDPETLLSIWKTLRDDDSGDDSTSEGGGE